jgi:hypothetical protein
VNSLYGSGTMRPDRASRRDSGTAQVCDLAAIVAVLLSFLAARPNPVCETYSVRRRVTVRNCATAVLLCRILASCASRCGINKERIARVTYKTVATQQDMTMTRPAELNRDVRKRDAETAQPGKTPR